MTIASALPLHASRVHIQGPDALAFAQSQFSSDVAALEIGAWQWSAWLDARGHVVALFHLARTGDEDLVLVLRGCDCMRVATALQRYVFRARVTITPASSLPVHDARATGAYTIDGDIHDLRLGLDTGGIRIASRTATDSGAWRLQAIRAGHPWLPESLQGRFLAPALSLRRLGAVSFTKGCFPGQEIMARLHYRGGCHKNALCHLRLVEAIAPGNSVALGSCNGAAPIVLDCVAGDAHGHEALAVVHESVIAELPHGDAVQTDRPTLVQKFSA